jgi:hypothetical protein
VGAKNEFVAHKFEPGYEFTAKRHTVFDILEVRKVPSVVELIEKCSHPCHTYPSLSSL